MGRVELVLWSLLAGAGCGRLGFGAVGIDPTNDGRPGDGSPGDGSPGDGSPGDGTTIVAYSDGRQLLSCTGLAETCGPAGTAPCCASTVVQGSTYYRSYDLGTDGMFPSMSDPATVSDFRLEMYEVTVGRFRQFVNAGLGTQQNPPATGVGARTLNGLSNQAGWDPSWNASLSVDTAALLKDVDCNSLSSWTDAPGLNESLPMNCLNWFEAAAFCAWDGGFLPTEAEWNYAAAGGSEQRAYPWSNPASSLTIDCSYANYFINTPNGTKCVNGNTGGVNRVGSESPMGDGRWGQTDLAGNVREWTLDWYAIAYGNPCNDCAVLTAATSRVPRGGNFILEETHLRGGNRSEATPATRFAGQGVRCARSP